MLIDYKEVKKEMIENGYTIREMAKRIGKSKSVVHYHLRKLVDREGDKELGKYLSDKYQRRKNKSKGNEDNRDTREA